MISGERLMRGQISLAVAVLVGLQVVGLWAMQDTTQIHPGMGGSPHVRTEWAVAGANISIEYGRPYLKGRTIGKDLVPYGEVWRAGADEATTLTIDKTLIFGNLTVLPGTYTLWVMPAADQWLLIVNKQTGQWGTMYDANNDLGRAEMMLEELSEPVEQHTFSIDEKVDGGVLKIEFGTTRASIKFSTYSRISF